MGEGPAGEAPLAAIFAFLRGFFAFLRRVFRVLEAGADRNRGRTPRLHTGATTADLRSQGGAGPKQNSGRRGDFRPRQTTADSRSRGWGADQNSDRGCRGDFRPRPTTADLRSRGGGRTETAIGGVAATSGPGLTAAGFAVLERGGGPGRGLGVCSVVGQLQAAGVRGLRAASGARRRWGCRNRSQVKRRGCSLPGRGPTSC